MDKLLPCPFCGEAKALIYEAPPNKWHNICETVGCEASVGAYPFKTWEEAASAWNTRAALKEEEHD